jgi:hypothetical protein
MLLSRLRACWIFAREAAAKERAMGEEQRMLPCLNIESSELVRTHDQ